MISTRCNRYPLSGRHYGTKFRAQAQRSVGGPLDTTPYMNFTEMPFRRLQRLPPMPTPRLLPLLCSTLLALCLAGTGALASSVLQQPIETIIEESPLIFEGKVTAIQTQGSGKRVYTWITFDVLDVIKGAYAERRIKLRYLGGTADGVTVQVTDQTMPAYGEQGIYFLESLDTLTLHPLQGWGQGHFILDHDPARNTYIVRNSEGRVVTGLSREGRKGLGNLNAKSAAGVHTSDARTTSTALQSAVTRETFKAFIKEGGQ